ncbi:MAG: Mur ligase family protein, partial [Leeuwenhoekiella sp.]
DGTLFIKEDLALKGVTVGFERNAVFSIHNVTIKSGAFHFDLSFPEGILEDIKIKLPGRHNVFNAATALAMAIKFGVSP